MGTEMSEKETVDVPERFDLASQPPTTDRIDGLRALFPEAFAEDSVDFDALRRSLGNWIDPGPERFGLTWPGKAECMRVVQESSIGTLVPMPGESVDWETTQNVIIEGENLEALKLLQKAYYGKVKMIYIDPPYNTGKEFIYPDNFSEGLDDYLRYSGQVDGEGIRLSANSETAGRYHSKWLSMMYPRLFLARNLLREDGVIFVSIDDHEVHNLRGLLNDLFGEENFIATLVWNTQGHTDNQFQIKVMHEYVHVYARSASNFEAGYVVDPSTREESNLWRGVAENSITKNGPANPPSWIELPAGFPCAVDELDLEPQQIAANTWQELESVGYIRRELTQRHGLAYPLRRSALRATGGVLIESVHVFSGWANRNKLLQFIEGDFAPLEEPDGSTLEFFLSDRGVIYYRRHRENRARNIVSVLRNFGTVERARSALEARDIFFDYPKPPDLISYLIRIGGASGDDIVLDFFAGSGTTAESVQDVNRELESELRYILVQLPEPSSDSAHALISEIPRLRMAADESGLPSPDGLAQMEGFRSFKLEESCFRVWDGTTTVPGDPVAEMVSLFADNTREDATEAAIVTELLLKAGFELTADVRQVELAKEVVHSVEDGQLLIYVGNALTLRMIEAMVELEPSLILVLDAGFGDDDELKVNAMQTVRSRNQGAGSDIALKVV